MSKSKKVFLLICLLFLCIVAIISYDMGSRTTFPGSKSQLKERLKKRFETADSVSNDSLPTVQR